MAAYCIIKVGDCRLNYVNTYYFAFNNERRDNKMEKISINEKKDYILMMGEILGMDFEWLLNYYHYKIDKFISDDLSKEECLAKVVDKWRYLDNVYNGNVIDIMEDEDLVHIPVHGMSVNYLFTAREDWKPLVPFGAEDKDGNVAFVKTPKYLEWEKRIRKCRKYIPSVADWEAKGVDFTQPIKIVIGYKCVVKMDILNLDKSFIDELFTVMQEQLVETGRFTPQQAKEIFDDNLIDKANIERIGDCHYILDYNDDTSLNNKGGHIWFKFVNYIPAKSNRRILGNGGI